MYTINGAKASAIAHSVINTAIANGLNARDYLTQVFTHPGELIIPLKPESK